MSDDGSKGRMVRSAAALIASRGLNATSFAEVIEKSGAPRGSIYHHFPEGKRQLAEAAIAWTTKLVLDRIATSKAKTPKGVLEDFIAMWRRVVVDSDATMGCAVAGVAIDTYATDPELLTLVRQTFAEWTDALRRRFEETGLPSKRSASFAVIALAAMEGALVLCRAERSAGPLETVAHELLRLLD